MIDEKTIREIAYNIINNDFDHVKLWDLCKSKVKELEPNISDFQLIEIAEDMEKKLVKHIKNALKSYEDKGLPPPYKFGNIGTDNLIRYTIEDEPIHIAALRRNKNKLKKAIEKLDWRSFEYLCSYILKNEIGNDKIYTGKGTKEGGIDIYGIIDLKNYNRGFLLKKIKLRLIGQAKKWSNKVGDNIIAELRTKYHDLLNKSGSTYDNLPDWFKNYNESIISIVITASSFTKGAKNSAKNDDLTMILVENDELIEMMIKLPDSKEWLIENTNGKLEFDTSSFNRFIRKINGKMQQEKNFTC